MTFKAEINGLFRSLSRKKADTGGDSDLLVAALVVYLNILETNNPDLKSEIIEKIDLIVDHLSNVIDEYGGRFAVKLKEDVHYIIQNRPERMVDDDKIYQTVVHRIREELSIDNGENFHDEVNNEEENNQSESDMESFDQDNEIPDHGLDGVSVLDEEDDFESEDSDGLDLDDFLSADVGDSQVGNLIESGAISIPDSNNEDSEDAQKSESLPDDEWKEKGAVFMDIDDESSNDDDDDVDAIPVED